MKTVLYILTFCCVSLAQSQNVIITEYLADPSGGTDIDAEWIELYNASSDTINIQGWILKDSLNDSIVLSPGVALKISPKAYLLLGRNPDMGKNGGITLNYAYAGFNLSNVEDRIILCNDSNRIIDKVRYKNPTAGASANLDPGMYNAVDNDDPANWCLSTVPFGTGDKGSPGALNAYCGLAQSKDLSQIGQKSVYLWNSNLYVPMAREQTEAWTIVDATGKTVASGVLESGTDTKTISVLHLHAGWYSFKIPQKDLQLAFFVVNP